MTLINASIHTLAPRLAARAVVSMSLQFKVMGAGAAAPPGLPPR